MRSRAGVHKSFITLGFAVFALSLCGSARASQLETQREVPGWPGRAYDLVLPSSYGELPEVALIVAIHGGGGNKRAQRKLSCPDGDLRDPGCMHLIADRAGFAVAYPNGTGARIFRNLRTWNAGGGRDGFQCVSGRACADGVDDVAYFEAMLDDIGSMFQIDTSAVYVTGMSNGAAMAHRLACELAGRVTGIAAVGGANQHATIVPCRASTAVMQIHGDSDPCWPYVGGELSCLDANDGAKASVSDTVEDWAQRNECKGPPEAAKLPDSSADMTFTTVYRYQRCRKPVVLFLIRNGGHTWPGGYQYFREVFVGKMSLDFSASEQIVNFFKSQRIAQ
jgi:polyhydroxybutyrate depolymerase